MDHQAYVLSQAFFRIRPPVNCQGLNPFIVLISFPGFLMMPVLATDFYLLQLYGFIAVAQPD